MSTPSVVRMRVPDADIAFDDLVRGPVIRSRPRTRLRHRARQRRTALHTGQPRTTNTHHFVLRGEDLLPSTPRQIVLYDALKQIGVGGAYPCFGHLPTVLGEATGGRPSGTRDRVSPNTSKRDICRKGC